MDENPYASTPNSSEPNQQRKAVKRVIKTVNPLQLGKVLGMLYVLISLIVVPFLIIVAMLSHGGGNSGPGIFILLILPVLYGIGGFIGGCILGFFYNLCARIVGGIEMELA